MINEMYLYTDTTLGGGKGQITIPNLKVEGRSSGSTLEFRSDGTKINGESKVVCPIPEIPM